MATWRKISYFILTKSAGLWINVCSFFHPKKAGKMAYTLFSVPRSGKLTHFTPFLEKASKKTLLCQDQTIQTYFWEGSGETILLIHGWESNSNRWQGLIQYLKKKHYFIVAVDAPGQGMSSGKELNPVLYSQFLDVVCKEYRPQYLIGHSLGAMTMFYYYSKSDFPSVKKIVGLGSPNKFTRITRNYKNLISLNKLAFQNYLQIFLDQFSIRISEFSTQEFIQNIQIPILLIHDQEDTIVPYHDALEIVAQNPKVHFQSTQNLGHSLYDKRVYKEIVQFLKSDK